MLNRWQHFPDIAGSCRSNPRWQTFFSVLIPLSNDEVSLVISGPFISAANALIHDNGRVHIRRIARELDISIGTVQAAISKLIHHDQKRSKKCKKMDKKTISK